MGMFDLKELLFSAITGFLGGFLICIPVGPINITILNEGARKGFVWAFLIGCGAMGMDVIYCSIGFASFSGLLTSHVARATMELLSFLLTFVLGIKYLVVRDLPATTRTLEAVEHQFHPHTAFMIGFVRVLGNPAVLLFWITLSATFIAHDWVAPNLPSKAACVSGNALGGLTWFFLLSYVVSRGHGKFSKRSLILMSRFSGASLLIVAVFLGIRLIKLLAHK